MICVIALVLLACIAGLTASVVVVKYLIPVCTVKGDSMLPTFRDGDLILTTGIFNKNKLKVGDVIVYRAPYDEGKKVIKRINDIREGYVYCLGDNPEASYDSRYYGWVPYRRIFSKMVRKL